MFNSFKYIKYYESDDVRMISLHYISYGPSFRMIIILPNNNKYENPLDYTKKENINFKELFSLLKYTNNVDLYLPIFENDFEINNLTSILKDLLMIKSFNNFANFRNIIEDNIKLNKIYKKLLLKLMKKEQKLQQLHILKEYLHQHPQI